MGCTVGISLLSVIINFSASCSCDLGCEAGTSKDQSRRRCKASNGSGEARESHTDVSLENHRAFWGFLCLLWTSRLPHAHYGYTVRTPDFSEIV